MSRDFLHIFALPYLRAGLRGADRIFIPSVFCRHCHWPADHPIHIQPIIIPPRSKGNRHAKPIRPQPLEPAPAPRQVASAAQPPAAGQSSATLAAAPRRARIGAAADTRRDVVMYDPDRLEADCRRCDATGFINGARCSDCSGEGSITCSKGGAGQCPFTYCYCEAAWERQEEDKYGG